MEIDDHRRGKHSPDKFHLFIEIEGKIIRETTFPEIENVIRDISYVRRQSTNFLSLYGGQFDFERMLTLPYWDFLFIKGGINNDELVDIQDGCLLILALFYVEIYDDTGSSYIYSNKLFEKLDNALNIFNPTTERQKAAIEKIKFLRKYCEDDKVLRRIQPDDNSIEIEKEIEDSNQFLYKELVENYFWEMAKSFDVFRQQSAERHRQLMDKQKKP